MRLSKKILLLAAGVAALIFGLVQLYSFFRYTLYREYKELTAQTYVDASKEFEALQDSGEGVPGMELVSESETLKLYASAKTAEIAILDKRNSKVWRSNPEDIDDDSIANKVNKSLLKSQLVLEYYDANRRPGNYNSYDYSVSRGQVEMSAIEGGVRFTYVLGDLESKTGIVPIYITQERLDFFMEALAQAEDGAAGVTYITSRYRDAGTVPGFLELMGNESVGASTLRRLRENFEKAGYTKDDFESDMMASEVEGAVPVSFTVCVDYRVEGDSLVCRIPKDLLDEGVGASISGIQLLRGLGAGGPQETGFALVPDGSGALMRFNNGKTSSEDYIQAVYGIDPMYMDFTVVGNTEKARLPIFGSSHEDSSILALIERGDSFATITATQGGKLSSYTCVYPTFMLRSNMSLSMFGITGNEAEMPVMEKDLYNSDIQVRYFFLDEPGYNPMAKRLRDELIEDGVLEAKNPGEIPLYIDLISGVEADRFVLGIKYQETLPMTTFKEAIGIHESLKEKGAKTQVVNIQGWFNDGYYHDAINKVSLVKKLGTKKDLNSLKESIESSNGRLYLDADFQRVPLNSKGFNDARAGARYYGGGYVGTFGFVNPTSYANVSGLGYLERIYTLLSPKFLPRQIESFAKAIGKYPSSGVSARDLGEII
ncbi:MAG: DUF5696 domain-containing protein, partial [Clostridiales bacterium]|nr:DUF5696 domain-containing protein [Clostridiales bacterium]